MEDNCSSLPIYGRNLIGDRRTNTDHVTAVLESSSTELAETHAESGSLTSSRCPLVSVVTRPYRVMFALVNLPESSVVRTRASRCGRSQSESPRIQKREPRREGAKTEEKAYIRGRYDPEEEMIGVGVRASRQMTARRQRYRKSYSTENKSYFNPFGRMFIKQQDRDAFADWLEDRPTYSDISADVVALPEVDCSERWPGANPERPSVAEARYSSPSRDRGQTNAIQADGRRVPGVKEGLYKKPRHLYEEAISRTEPTATPGSPNRPLVRRAFSSGNMEGRNSKSKLPMKTSDVNANTDDVAVSPPPNSNPFSGRQTTIGGGQHRRANSWRVRRANNGYSTSLDLSGPSQPASFDIVGQTAESRFPWQHDVGVQCSIMRWVPRRTASVEIPDHCTTPRPDRARDAWREATNATDPSRLFTQYFCDMGYNVPLLSGCYDDEVIGRRRNALSELSHVTNRYQPGEGRERLGSDNATNWNTTTTSLRSRPRVRRTDSAPVAVTPSSEELPEFGELPGDTLPSPDLGGRTDTLHSPRISPVPWLAQDVPDLVVTSLHGEYGKYESRSDGHYTPVVISLGLKLMEADRERGGGRVRGAFSDGSDWPVMSAGVLGVRVDGSSVPGDDGGASVVLGAMSVNDVGA
ncbi:hypothetical protein LSH36_188g02004 [Paralvinella palmiformis]|uniref:Uncharacterized protein n=1 Tax=Paralvinella palmiformis TaxID=53620 RepID=A0AAD9N599_9ANNE|nr:hypothetical protein LSH36_188g02004 [Paralvinella palmiformis]